jgi:hypothetical protein
LRSLLEKINDTVKAGTSLTSSAPPDTRLIFFMTRKPSSSFSMATNEDADSEIERREAFRLVAKQTFKQHKHLRTLLTPLEFEDRGREIFNDQKNMCPRTQSLLSKFHQYETTWHVESPDKTWCQWQRDIVQEEFDCEIDAHLKLSILVPKHLLSAEKIAPLKIAVRFHGGGGVGNFT